GEGKSPGFGIGPARKGKPAGPLASGPPRGCPDRRVTGRRPRVAVDGETRKRVDKWIRDNNRNDYGDSKDTVYAGGTPLFDMRTGKTKDRYEHILEKHPELRKK